MGIAPEILGVITKENKRRKRNLHIYFPWEIFGKIGFQIRKFMSDPRVSGIQCVHASTVTYSISDTKDPLRAIQNNIIVFSWNAANRGAKCLFPFLDLDI